MTSTSGRLQALPMLSEAELPPAVGLVLKLASESPLARAPAVSTGPAQHSAVPELVLEAMLLCKLCRLRLRGVVQPAVMRPRMLLRVQVRCVRTRVRCAAPGAAGGTLDAMRLAVLQHRDVASAVLADIDSDARAAKPLSAPDAQVCSCCGSRADTVHLFCIRQQLHAMGLPSSLFQFGLQENGSAPALDAASSADLEVLLDLLAVPELRAEVWFVTYLVWVCI